MALPDPKQKPRTPPKPTAASKDPKGTAVGRGFETQPGTAKVETGAKGQGFGLSSGGGGGDGGVKLDVANFCCPEYLARHARPHHQELESEAAGGGYRDR